MSLKILIIGPAHPLRGGIAALNEKLAETCMQAGYRTEIVSFSLQYPSFLFPGKTQYSDSEKPKGLNIRSIINTIYPINWIRVGLTLKKEKHDLVIIRYWLPFMGPALGTIARMIASNKHSKIIALADNIIPHEKRPGDTLFTRYFIKPCKGFIVLSRSVENDLKKLKSDAQILYTPHPIYNQYGKRIEKSEARKKLGIEENGKLILFFGFIRPYKGLDLLLEAFCKESVRKHQVRLLVAGEFYENEEFYRTFIENNGLKDAVILHNTFIPDERVHLYFSACDMVAQPYKTATQSGVTQIAYAFHTPMLVTQTGGLPEMVEDGKAGYVVPTNPSAIANAIDDFYSHNKEEFFRRGVEQDKEKYSWEIMLEKTLAFYEQIKF